MPPMRLTILGSGSNLHPTRAAAGYLVRTDRTILLDFGPRTLMNLLKTGVDRHRITHILFSHFHADHFADFIPFFFDAAYYSQQLGRREGLTIIGPRGTKRLFNVIVKTFPGFSSAQFRLTIREVAARSFRIGRTRITPHTVAHSQRLHCLGYRIQYGKKVLAYSGDATYCEGLLKLCRKADVAVLDCSFPANRPGRGHMHAEDCGRIAQEAGITRLILSHFYPIADRYDVTRQAERWFSGQITRGRDLLTVRV